MNNRVRVVRFADSKQNLNFVYLSGGLSDVTVGGLCAARSDLARSSGA